MMARRDEGGFCSGCFGCLFRLLVVASLLFLAVRFDVLGHAQALLYSMGLIDRPAQVQGQSSNEAFQQGEGAQAYVPEYDVSLESGYVYKTLDDQDKERYRAIYQALSTRTEVDYPDSDLDHAGVMRDCVMADHPELFYVSGVQMETSAIGDVLKSGSVISGKYRYTEEETESLNAQIDSAAYECLSSAVGDDYEKAKYVYEYLVQTIDYDQGTLSSADGSSSGQTIVDSLVSRRCVCAGYANAFNYLMHRLDIPCLYVSGTARGENHAWCKVQLDGLWYIVDPTWGDPTFDDSGDSGSVPADYVNYGYLCVTDEDAAGTHSETCGYQTPECFSMDDNYYVREGLYFDGVYPDVMGPVISDAFASGRSFVSFRLANDEALSSMLDWLSSDEVWAYVPSDHLSHSVDQDMRTIALWL